MQILYSIFRPVRQFMWALTLAYMMAWHNVYNEEMKFPDDMAVVMDLDDEEEDASDR